MAETTFAPENTPVLIAVAAINQKQTDLTQSKEAIELMINAAEQGYLDSGSSLSMSEFFADCAEIAVPEGMWSYTDPARQIAKAIGADNAQSIFAKIGITQQTLMANACLAIASGDAEMSMVVGGEAKFRSLQARIQGLEVSETVLAASDGSSLLPDKVLQPDAELWLIEETRVGLGMPVGFYAAMESAWRVNQGLSIDENRDALAQLYADFSAVAAKNPHAWKPQKLEPSVIREGSDKNPMLAFPYTKLHNTSWNVDQACALIFCSVAKAKALGVPESKWVYLQTSTENNTMLSVAERPQLHRSFGAELAADALLQSSGISAKDIDVMDLYSCFPIAVEIYAKALGLADDQARTCTGGMPFAGGPLNNYALQAACRVVELLRENPGSYGLTSSVSGLLSKQAFGLWSTQAPKQGFQFIDVSDQVKEQEQPLTVLRDYEGDAKIVAYTIIFEANQAQRAIAICETDQQQRVVVFSEQADLLLSMQASEYCGKSVTIKDWRFECIA